MQVYGRYVLLFRSVTVLRSWLSPGSFAGGELLLGECCVLLQFGKSMGKNADQMQREKKMSASDIPHQDITYRIIGAAMRVHRRTPRGLKEKHYQRALTAELIQDRLSVFCHPSP